MNGFKQCARRMALLMRYTAFRPAILAAWLGLPAALIAFTALASVSVRLMFSAGSQLDGLGSLTGMGPSVVGAVMPMVEPVAIIAVLLVIRVLTNATTAVPLFLIEPRRTRLFLTLCSGIAIIGLLVTAAGAFAAICVSRLVLDRVVPAQAWPVPFSTALLLCLPVALILTGRMLIAAALCVVFDSAGRGAVAYIALYYLMPIVVANLPVSHILHEWLPSIAGTAILESKPAISPVLSGMMALAYAVIAIAGACIVQKRRDIG